MKNKSGLLVMGLLTVTLLAGCNSSEAMDLSCTSERKNPAVAGMDEGATENPQEPEEKQQVQEVKLTEETGTSIGIDYSIESYEALQNFSYELFTKNIGDTNPVLSPVSAYLALALAGAGAEGDTLLEFREVLVDLEGIPNDLMTGLPRDISGMQIALANSAWVDEQLTPDENWLAWADSIYKSEVYQSDLAAKETMQDMNQWINEKTNGLIPKLLEEPLDEAARLALFNTIYFKGDWKKSFSAESTVEREFYPYDDVAEKVEMMQMFREQQLYVKNDVAEGVILPYQDESMVFVALKPVEGLTVREMYEQLSPEDINGFLQQEETTFCNLRLPKFEVEFSKELNNSLIDMGLELAFDRDRADFSGLGTTEFAENLFIDLVYQKAVVIVDEEGTEAAAVTEVVLRAESCIESEMAPVNIFFDEPFLYMIMDMEREVPLFIGIMDNPNA